MLSLRHLLRQRPRILPFTQRRYPGPYVRHVIGRAKFLSSSSAALPFIIRPRSGRGRTVAAVPLRNRGIANLYAPKLGGNVVPVFPRTDKERFDEIHRRTLRTVTWKPKVNPAAYGAFIEKFGYEAFRQKVCEERRMRREVMHAKGVAGSPVSKPEFSLKSMVRC